MQAETGESVRPVTVFFSSPGDVGAEKARLAAVVEEMRPAFLRHSISLVPWTFEKNSVPLVAPVQGSVQTVIDRQMPRKPDGSIAYDLFVGLMDRRIGTPLKDAVSGTVHEFQEARKAFETNGKPHILFYFREREAPDGGDDLQMEGVQRFRSQYPGLFARYESIGDLEAQFRRHLLTELLDLFSPEPERTDAVADEWWDRVREQFAALHAAVSTTYLDRTPEKTVRIIRQLHLLLGIEHALSAHERRLLAASLLSALLGESDREKVKYFAPEGPESVGEIRDILARSADLSKLRAVPVGKTRLDLVAALVRIGWRLDLNRQGISPDFAGAPDSDSAAADESLAYLTEECVCQRGLVRFHLLAPSGKWVGPLIGATAIAMEASWQEVRSVLTRHSLSFAVARCRTEIDADVGNIPEDVFERIAKCAQNAIERLPKCPHLGEAQLPRLEELLPLPFSKVDSAVVFRAPNPGAVRLSVDGVVVAEAESGAIEYQPPAEKPVECVLECDEGGEFLPVVHSRLQRLGPAEAGVLDSVADKAEAFRALAMWNNLLAMIWPRLAGSPTNPEDLSGAFHILRDAFNGLPQTHDALLARRDKYWDAMEIVRNRLLKEEN